MLQIDHIEMRLYVGGLVKLFERKAADASIEMQEAVDAGLEQLEQLAAEMEGDEKAR